MNARPALRAESAMASAPRIARSSPVQRELAREFLARERIRCELPARRQDAERNRQIEPVDPWAAPPARG